MDTTFQNEKLQALYDKLNSYEGFQLRHIKTIHEAIYPLLKEVIYDSEAYAEAVFHWPLFQIVIDVLKNGNKEFVKFTESESMCYSLWWHTDHTHFENSEFDPELLNIFKGDIQKAEDEPEKEEDPYGDPAYLVRLHEFVSQNGLNVISI
jgi:hypothetical protein